MSRNINNTKRTNLTISNECTIFSSNIMDLFEPVVLLAELITHFVLFAAIHIDCCAYCKCSTDLVNNM